MWFSVGPDISYSNHLDKQLYLLSFLCFFYLPSFLFALLLSVISFQLNHLHTGLCQALLSAEAPIRALPGPSTRGAGDLLSSYFSFPRTPGFCSDLLFAGFRSHRFSPGGHTTLVYPITINSQQSSLVSNHTNKSCLGQTAILSEWILGSGGGWDTLQASSQARNSVFTLGHVS